VVRVRILAHRTAAAQTAEAITAVFAEKETASPRPVTAGRAAGTETVGVVAANSANGMIMVDVVRLVRISVVDPYRRRHLSSLLAALEMDGIRAVVR